VSDTAVWIGKIMSDEYGWHYNLFLATLIFITTYFYVAVFVNLVEISDTLKREGAFIPGIKPGRPTINYIDDILTRTTFVGSVFLAFVAIMPALAYHTGIDSEMSRFYGGTSLLIVIGSILEFTQHTESYFYMEYYKKMVSTNPFRTELGIIK
jgi:preprotein translocase subunit SecY